MIPETHYAKTVDGVHIAYQVLGSGPMDLVFMPGFVTNLEAVWQWPVAAAYLRRLATFSRLLIFDRRGTGLSDHLVQGEYQLTVEARVDDLRAVMDDASSRSSVLFGAQDGTAVCALFGATYPDRVIGLVAYASSARGLWAADYPWAWSEEGWAEYLERVDRGWGTYAFAEEEARIAWPDFGADPEWVNRYARWMRMAAGPGDAAAIERTYRDLDIRDILPRIQAPTLLIHRTGDEMEPVEQSRYMAGRIPGARLVELPGRNHGWAEPNQDEVLDVVAQFLTELRREEAEFDRVLATVLFTDIVGSTEHAAKVGNARWKELVEHHHERIRGQLARYRGVEIDTAGDGFFASFDGPARAIRCALSATRAVSNLGIEIRAGIHTGECEVIDNKVGGIAVNIGARVASLAGPGEVVVSQTVKDLVAGSGLQFEDRGEHELKGVPDRWRLFRVVET